MRINIYVPGAEIRRRVKAAAARRDLTVSEYCLQAIRVQLAREEAGVSPAPGEPGAAVARARRFLEEAFGGRVFRVSSASLIRHARRGR